MNLRPLAVWLMIIAAECVHGFLREIFLEARYGDRVTHQIGVAIGSALAFAITLAMVRWMLVRSTLGLVSVGASWMAMTFTFDVVLGRALVEGSFARVIADYDPRRGGLMLLGMAVLALSPLVAARLRRVNTWFESRSSQNSTH